MVIQLKKKLCLLFRSTLCYSVNLRYLRKQRALAARLKKECVFELLLVYTKALCLHHLQTRNLYVFKLDRDSSVV